MQVTTFVKKRDKEQKKNKKEFHTTGSRNGPAWMFYFQDCTRRGYPDSRGVQVPSVNPEKKKVFYQSHAWVTAASSSPGMRTLLANFLQARTGLINRHAPLLGHGSRLCRIRPHPVKTTGIQKENSRQRRKLKTK